MGPGLGPWIVWACNHYRTGTVMANTRQARKRVRQNTKKGAINTARRSRIRSYVKRVEVAITEGRKDDAMEALKQAQPEIMRGVTRGVLHKNTASRKVSRLNTRIKAMSA